MSSTSSNSETMGRVISRRVLYAVLRFDAFQTNGGAPFGAWMTAMKRPVYDNQREAEDEAARLNLQAPSGVHYFVRALVNPLEADRGAS